MIEIREEESRDIPSIREVNRLAFGQDQEAHIVDALRANGAVRLSLVACIDGAVVGHILYSPATIGGVEGAGLTMRGATGLARYRDEFLTVSGPGAAALR